MTPQEQQKLERIVDRALHDLPARKAPRSLEARVNAEIARRAALPWWHKSFSHWPFVARLLFAVLSLAIVKGLFLAIGWVSAGYRIEEVKAAFAPEIHMGHACIQLVNTAGDILAAIVSSVPPLWLYGGAAVIIALYMTLFGLGAAAYRALYANN